jgi:arabinan endo-1,5-alpha-L-arabinosidase
MARNFLCFLILSAAAIMSRAADEFIPQALSGQTFIHDPSSIIADKGVFYIYGTGLRIPVKTSPDLVHWHNAKSVFFRPPKWTKVVVPDFNGFFWAPDIIQLRGQYYLYYSLSVWGKQTSAIGVATNPTLDASAPNYHWTDGGEIIHSTSHAAFNAIDPSVFLDADGKLWLAFGSYWQGIFLTELDPQTGRRISTNSPLYNLAWNHSIEAACLTRHEQHYFLFVNWGRCCQGTNSTYEVRVGRAEKITGPYLDREGKNLLDGGGSPFLKSAGRFIGPGHIGILHDRDTDRFSYHYYDAATQGKSRLALGSIDWSGGWPVPMK